MSMETRSAPKNYGGSYDPERPMRPGMEPFHLEEKIDEMLAYGLPLTDKFPRRRRRLADEMRDMMLEMEKLVIALRMKYSKKTTLENLDITLAMLKKFVILAADKQYNGEQYAPPLTAHQRETWSRMNNEIGCMIGSYKKAVEEGRTGKRQ